VRAFVAIVKREFFSYFVSPLGYLVLTSFLLVSGWVFMVLVGALNAPETPRMALMSTFFTNVFQWIFLMLVSAIIAMRLLTEERRSGSIETLLTAPVSEATVVAAKFAGAWCFFLFLFVPTAIYPLLLTRFGGLDPLYQASAGLEFEAGAAQHGHEPLYYRFGMCDAANALLSIVGVLAALYRKTQSGKGQELWTSLMDGGAVFKFAVKVLAEVAQEALAANDLPSSAIDWLIPHQANIRIMEATIKKLALPMERMVSTVADHANTSAASIPLALDIAVRDGRIQAGNHVMLAGVGGGFTWGSVLLRWQ